MGKWDNSWKHGDLPIKAESTPIVKILQSYYLKKKKKNPQGFSSASWEHAEMERKLDER